MNIALFFSVLAARWKIALLVFAGVVGATVAVTLLLPKSYTATATVLVDPQGADPVTGLPATMQLLPSFLATQRDIVQSRTVALKVVDQLKLAQSPSALEQFQEAAKGRGNINDWLADRIVSKLEVLPSRDSSILNVSYTASDARFAQAMANGFATAYIEKSLQLKVAPSQQSATWFDSQTKELRANLDRAQASLSNFQQKHGIIATDERIDVETMRLTELSTQLVMAQSQRYESNTRKEMAERALGGAASAESLPEIVNNALIQGLKVQLAQREAALADVSQQYGVNHPEYQRLRREVDSMRAKVASEIAKVARSMSNVSTLDTRREADIRRSLADQKERVLRLKQQRDQAATLQREVEGAQRAFDIAMQRSTQTNLESKRDQTNAVMLAAAAEPLEPSSPRVVLNTLAALMLGSILAVMAALLAESLDARVRSAEQIAAALALPVLCDLKKSKHRPRPRLPALPFGPRPTSA